MKIRNIFPILTTVLLSSNLVLADGECKNRNNCNVVGWNYQAKARTYKVLHLWASTTDNTCGGTAWANRDNGCAWQQSINNEGFWIFNGEVYKNPNSCGRGNEQSDLYSSLLLKSKLDDSKSDSYEKSDITVSKTIFNEKSIKIEQIKGNFNLKGNELFSSFELVMWLPAKAEDSVWNDKNTFFKAKVIFHNGELMITGDFPRESFNITKNNKEGNTTCDFDFSIEVNLPNGINGKSDLIEVVGISDAGQYEKEVIDDYLNNLDNQNYILSPNPASTFLKIESKEEINFNNCEIFNLSGLKMSLPKENVEKIDNHNIRVNLNQVIKESGTYYILFETNGRLILKKFIFEN